MADSDAPVVAPERVPQETMVFFDCINKGETVTLKYNYTTMTPQALLAMLNSELEAKGLLFPAARMYHTNVDFTDDAVLPDLYCGMVGYQLLEDLMMD